MRTQISPLHPAWIDGEGVESRVHFFHFEIAFFEHEDPGYLLVEFRHMNGSREAFESFFQGLAMKLGATENVRPPPRASPPTFTTDQPTDYGYASTQDYLAELLMASWDQQLEGLRAVVTLAKDIFVSTDDIFERVATLAQPPGTHLLFYRDQFQATALAALSQLQWGKALQTAAQAVVLGVFEGFHARREALHCILALKNRPEALEIILRDSDTLMQGIHDIQNGDDFPAILLANSVQHFIENELSHQLQARVAELTFEQCGAISVFAKVFRFYRKARVDVSTLPKKRPYWK